MALDGMDQAEESRLPHVRAAELPLLTRRSSRLSHVRAAELAPAAAAAGITEQSPRSSGWLWRAMEQAHELLGLDSDYVDPLVALVRHDPAAAAWLIQVVMLSGGILSALACGVTGLLLVFRWGDCGLCCDRPLRLWLFINAILQVVQVPVRLRFADKIYTLRRLIRIDSTNNALLSPENTARLESCVVVMTRHWSWSLARLDSLLTYGWTALGFIWVINSSPCICCPSGLRFTCGAMMALAGLKLLFVAELFNKTIGRDQRAQDRSCAEHQLAATAEEVALLPTSSYCNIKRSSPGSNHTQCVVCCSEYHERDLCRILPCGHHFHKQCVDKWLERSTRCPLCMRDIRQATGSFSSDSATDQNGPP